MKKCELLIPVGNYECLEAAVYNGADAVYLAGKDFGARKYADNFDNDSLMKAVKFAHLYGVKVYVTVNTLIYENEVNNLVTYIDFLYSIGVDALIIQDLGMVTLIHDKYPDFEIHASTQMHNVSEEGCKYLEKMGVKRLVFARELSLNEINNIKTPLEKEVFIHGALCVCYSGQCLYSSLVGGRSGNRGACAGSCRLPYELYEDDNKVYTEGNYLLSTKEFSSLTRIKEILDSNIDSLKIEGRMKGKTYVGFITHLYRKLIDNYYLGKNVQVSKEDIKKISLIFNRDFTEGYLFNKKNKDIVNIKSPNHKGLLIGNVISVTKDKIKIELTDDLNQEDGIRFQEDKGMIVNFLYDNKMKLTNKVKKGDICYVDNKISLTEKTSVYKTIDSNLEKEVASYEKKRIGIDLKVTAKINEQLSVTFDNITLKGSIVQASVNRPSTKEDIVRSLSKLGNTPFYINNIDIECDEDIFISVSELNDLRRRCIDLVIERRENKYDRSDLGVIKRKEFKNELTHDISVLVRDEDRLKYVLNKNVDVIYVTDYNLYNKYKEDKRVFYRVSRIDNSLNFENERLLISELGTINKYPNNNYTVTDAYSNVLNSYTVNKLLTSNVKKVTLSYELPIQDINSLFIVYKAKIKSIPNVEVVVYGKPELMMMKYCLLNTLVNKESVCSVCKNKHEYYLKDRMNKKYRILQDNCINYIMHYKNINLLEEIDTLKNIGVTNFRVDFLDETYEEIDEILSYFNI